MKYTISMSSSSNPWEELENQRKFDNSTYEEEDLEIEEDVDDVDYDDMEEEDED